MLTQFTIRVAAPQDEPEVSAVLSASYGQLIASAYDKVALDAALPLMTRANPRLLASPSYYVAEADDGCLVGCGGWTNERPGSTDIEPGLGHIRHFGTHPAWTGKGIARAIFYRCVKDARAAGIRRFECYSSLNAEGFYAALGFQAVRQADIPMGPDVSLASIIMRCAI